MALAAVQMWMNCARSSADALRYEENIANHVNDSNLNK